MSLPIQPPEGPDGVAPNPRVYGAEADARAAPPVALGGIAAQMPLSSDTAPPAEVLAATEQAAQHYDVLRAQGLEVVYGHNCATGAVTAELRDSGGAVVRTLSPSEALALAAGEELPRLAEG